MIPSIPVDFGALADMALNYVGIVFAAVAGIVIVIALVRMGFKFVSSAFAGSVERVEIDDAITVKVYDDSNATYEWVIQSDDGIKVGAWSGDGPNGKVYFFDENGNYFWD